MKFDRTLIKYLSQLSRIECSEAQEEELLHDLKNIVAYVEQLQEIDTEEAPPCDHVIAGMINVERDDEIGDLLDSKTFLDNAPDQLGGMIKVPPVIKQG